MADQKQRFANELARQLRFLAKSAREYDDGDFDEAIRIATVLRVLFHDTGRSQSLKSHLRWKNLRMLSTAQPLGKGANSIGTLSNAEITIQELGITILPKLEKSHRRFLPFDQWWIGEAIFDRDGTLIHRRDLVLWAANKDGGAHVDDALEPKYAELLEGNWFQITQERTGVFKHTESAKLAPFAALRQIAFETLNTNLPIPETTD